MENTQLILDKINDLKVDNGREHKGLNGRLDTLNGTVAVLKKRQLVAKGIFVGIVSTLFILGFLPQRFYDLIKTVF